MHTEFFWETFTENAHLEGSEGDGLTIARLI
jgi:hypothetical protein